MEQNQQQELAAFVQWLPSNIAQFQGQVPEEIIEPIAEAQEPEQVVEVLNELSQSKEGKQIVSGMFQVFQQSKQGMFKAGGKLAQGVMKFQDSGKTRGTLPHGAKLNFDGKSYNSGSFIKPTVDNKMYNYYNNQHSPVATNIGGSASGGYGSAVSSAFNINPLGVQVRGALMAPLGAIGADWTPSKKKGGKISKAENGFKFNVSPTWLKSQKYVSQRFLPEGVVRVETAPTREDLTVNQAKDPDSSYSVGMGEYIGDHILVDANKNGITSVNYGYHPQGELHGADSAAALNRVYELLKKANIKPAFPNKNAQ